VRHAASRATLGTAGTWKRGAAPAHSALEVASSAGADGVYL
jgi:hypothetical protein